MASVKKAIKIYTRIKPNSDNSVGNYEIDKHINDDGSTDDILILNSSQSVDDYMSPMSVTRPEAYKFRFSKVFDEASNQDEVFDEICQPVLESALEGYNSTIFAYGQTGSGKTYTMTGSRQQWKKRGIIPRALSYVFEKFNDLTEKGFIASAFLSYLEIYNESGYDLLHSGFSSGRIEDLKKVQLLEDAQQQIHMKNLTVHPIKSEDEAMQLLYLGDHNRIIAETPMNEASTRSHCIFTIHINIREGASSTIRRSKVHLVDLAGSERLANSTSTGQLFHEARHINLALHYLEQVIVALGEAHRSHIPYRNSMMTSILRDSLGGNCMTTMIATISLENRNIMETLSTCRFSQRVALVTNAAVLNEETDPMLLIAQLKSENKRLKEIIANSTIKNIDASSGPLTQEDVADCWKLVEKFMADLDEEAILPVQPDMRMVQTCFRCLKLAAQMNKEEIEGIHSGLTVPAPDGDETAPEQDFTSIPTFEKNARVYSETMSREELLECLRVRDAEIDVLRKIVKTGHQKEKMSELKTPSLAALRDNYSNDLPLHLESTSTFPIDEEESKPPNVPPSPKVINVMEVLTPAPNPPVVPSEKHNLFGKTKEIGGTPEIDTETIFLEGLSEAKREALESFMRSYKGREKLENVKETLLSKRNEVESIETLLRRNHANLNNLRVVMMSSEGGGEEEDNFMKEAVESQSQSIQKQERQLYQSKEEMRHIEENLKSLYVQLMGEFERHWVAMKEFRGKMGIPSEINFLEIQDPDPKLEEKGETKPFVNITKGLVEGVSGGSSARNAKSFELNKILATMMPSLNSAHSSKRCFSPSSSKRRSSSCRGKQATPTNSPRPVVQPEASSSSRKSYRQPSASHRSPRGVAPPPTATGRRTAESSIPIHFIHRHQDPDFAGEKSTLNLVDLTPRQKHRKKKGKPDSSNYGDDFARDNEDEELLKELPMTGDATIDQEILSFFRTRQAVFRRINSDNSIQLGGTNTGLISCVNNNNPLLCSAINGNDQKPISSRKP